MNRKIPFYKHNINSKDIKNGIKILKQFQIATGAIVEDFNLQFANLLAAPFCVGLNSGTAALHLSLLNSNVNQDSEVITSPLTFCATAHAIEYTGAKTKFIDVNFETGLINEEECLNSIKKNTKAIVLVNLYGQMCNYKKVFLERKNKSFFIIEDAAHSIEAQRDQYGPGTYSDFACFSFQATKNITSIEGGAIVFKNKNLKPKIQEQAYFGLNKKLPLNHEILNLGYKYNMSNFQAALLLDQINVKRLFSNLKKRETIAQVYKNAFLNNDRIRLLKILDQTKTSWHLYPIFIESKYRNLLYERLQAKGLSCLGSYRSLHLMSYYKEKYGLKKNDFPNSYKLSSEVLCLPIYPQLKLVEVEKIASIVLQEINKL